MAGPTRTTRIQIPTASRSCSNGIIETSELRELDQQGHVRDLKPRSATLIWSATRSLKAARRSRCGQREAAAARRRLRAGGAGLLAKTIADRRPQRSPLGAIGFVIMRCILLDAIAGPVHRHGRVDLEARRRLRRHPSSVPRIHDTSGVGSCIATCSSSQVSGDAHRCR